MGKPLKFGAKGIFPLQVPSPLGREALLHALGKFFGKMMATLFLCLGFIHPYFFTIFQTPIKFSLRYDTQCLSTLCFSKDSNSRSKIAISFPSTNFAWYITAKYYLRVVYQINRVKTHLTHNSLL